MNLKLFIGCCWSILGGIRGSNVYDYRYKKQTNDTPYTYSSKLRYGIAGAFMYMHPGSFIMVAPKELYRIRVWLHNIDKGDYYNDLFI